MTPPVLFLVFILLVIVSFSSGFTQPNSGICKSHLVAFAASQNQRPTSSSNRRKKKTGGNQNWYNKRKAGVKVKSRGPKPPKWEKEGDNLYVNHNQQQDNGDAGRRHPIKDITYDQARELLRPFESIDAIPIQASKSTASTSINDEEDHFKAEPPFLWGGLSVGPVWKSRLVQAGFDTPTPIQKASYHTLSNKKECRPSQVFIAVNW